MKKANEVKEGGGRRSLSEDVKPAGITWGLFKSHLHAIPTFLLE